MTDLIDRPKSDVAKREEAILNFWNERKIFEKSVNKDAPKGDFIFYDGPPFATGTPHYGHIVASVIKDVVPRYRTMRGYRVPRIWGWDCHGLPIENIVEKQLGFKHKKEIKEYGIAKFNEQCRAQVLTYAHEWERFIPRIGRWVDMEHAYRTMDKDFMESVWWVFKQLYDKGLVYEDYRVMHICPRCETTLSQQEVAEGYRDVKDIAVTVKFKVKNPEHIGLTPGLTQGGPVYLLAWTTTPWTLPGNVALAIGPDLSYDAFEQEGATYIRYTEGGRWKGSDLVGLAYEPLFNYYAKDQNLKNRENGWKVYPADFVTADAGTGIAHEAPAFGADDWELLKKYNLPFVQHVNFDGTMKAEVVAFAGMEVRQKSEDDSVRLSTDIAVLKYLQEHGLLFAKENIVHAYPHCWRCDTPLLNYATSSWFVAVTQIKETLLNTAQNIHWSPAHIKEGRFGKWLEGARDWSISRQRFWASVIPLWRCEECKSVRVFGSASELEEASGKVVDDLHKHIVDEITVDCTCGGTMRRIPDVLDTWFDSGSMPYGERHYPFENKEHFDAMFPAQFIAEGIDQTRAWFYYLHVHAGALFGKSAFQNAVVNGIVLAEDGKKMSKRLNNYPDPQLLVDKYGADALRLYFMTSPVVAAENLAFSERGVDEYSKKVIGRLGNVLAFYELYADGTPRGQESPHVLDRWILSRLQQLVAEMTAGFEIYHIDVAARPIGAFIDDLSVWYLRRSRDRFKGDDVADKQAALATLRYVLHTLARATAPVMPFMAEHVFQAVRENEDEESVHLASWPEESEIRVEIDVLTVMEQVRRIVSMALEARDKAGIKVRQPLATLTVEGAIPADEFAVLIRDEVNVKDIVSGVSVVLDTVITPTLREEGIMRDIVRTMQDARKAAQLTPDQIVHSMVLHVLPEQQAVAEAHIEEIKKIARVLTISIAESDTLSAKVEK